MLAPICLDGWWVEYHPEDDTFFVQKPIPNWKNPEPIEHQQNGSWFEYPTSCYRDIITDEFDLQQFLEEE